ncbi:MAG TPA: phosphoribosylformylglycinamidine synthase I [Tepidisphaeraceae bacterium]|jgi:phosphoribosylformylglycinamidine synthase
MQPRVLVLRTAGTNCDGETAYAFELAGAKAEFLHLNRLLENPRALDQFQLLAIPGGFSYGDDIAAGRIFANQLVHHLADALNRFVQQRKPVIGICNGFQVLVKTGLLPGPIAGRRGQSCTLAHNDCGRFIDRWVRLEPVKSKCIWTAGMAQPLELPIAHGEGKFVPADNFVREELWRQGQVVLTYSEARRGVDDAFAGNPNGSTDAIGGICDASGMILGLMPHPERHVSQLQHPAWTRRGQVEGEGEGLLIFRNAVGFAASAVGAGI